MDSFLLFTPERANKGSVNSQFNFITWSQQLMLMSCSRLKWPFSEAKTNSTPGNTKRQQFSHYMLLLFRVWHSILETGTVDNVFLVYKNDAKLTQKQAVKTSTQQLWCKKTEGKQTPGGVWLKNKAYISQQWLYVTFTKDICNILASVCPFLLRNLLLLQYVTLRFSFWRAHV